MDEIRNNELLNPQPDEKPKRKKIILLTSAVMLALAVCAALLGYFCQLKVNTEYVYNKGMIGEILREYVIYHVEEKWESKDMANLLPPPVADGMVPTVYPSFGKDNKLVKLKVVYTREKPEMKISVEWMIPEYNVRAWEEPINTTCGELTYLICEERAKIRGVDRLILGAETQMDGAECVFYMEGSPDMEAEMKMEFEFLLDLYGDYPLEKKGFYELQPKGKVHSYETDLTYEGVLDDPEFGRYLPAGVLKADARGNIFRSNNEYSNGLWCVWDYVNQSLSWYVSYNKEGTTAIPVENVTLEMIQSLITEEESTYIDGQIEKHIDMDVEIDDVIIEIEAVDIEPQWLYEQILSLHKVVYLEKLPRYTYPSSYNYVIKEWPSHSTVEPITDYMDAAQKGQQLWESELVGQLNGWKGPINPGEYVEVCYIEEHDTWLVKGTSPDYNKDYDTLDGVWTGVLPCAIIRSDGTVLAVGIV